MLLGLRSKRASVKLGYTVHVNEIRPWPPSASLRSVQIVCLQWEYGNKLSGSFVSSTAQDSVIAFNQSFKLPVVLYQEKKSHDKFRKNCVEFSLFTPRKDKVKGQLFGTAVINFADYGVIENTVSINVPLNLKKWSSNSVQSCLLINLEPDVKDSSSKSSPNVGLSKEPSLDNDSEQFEIASFTDDDTSSQSSRTGQLSTIEAASTSPPQLEKPGYGNAISDPEQNRNTQPSHNDSSSDTGNHFNDDASFRKMIGQSKTSVKKIPETAVTRSLVSSDIANRLKNNVSYSKFYERSMTSSEKNSTTPVIRSFASSISFQDTNEELKAGASSFLQESVPSSSYETIATNKNQRQQNTQHSSEENLIQGFELEAVSANNNMKNPIVSLIPHGKDLQPHDEEIHETHASLVNSLQKMEIKDRQSDNKIVKAMDIFAKSESIGKLSEGPTRAKVTIRGDEVPTVPSPSCDDRLQNVKSVEIRSLVKGNELHSDVYAGGGTPDPYISNSSEGKGKLGGVIERKKQNGEPSGCNSEWETRIEMLEDELREAAATEVGLYSVVAEHASSGNKVHAPARRLSRFYSNACKTGSQVKRSSAARVAISGLVVVSKSCGNDVPRLTFWLSNAIMLRSIISQTATEFPHSNGIQSKTKGAGSESDRMPSDQWADSSHLKDKESKSNEESDDWEDISSFILALEKVESWLFSRIVESLWWQSFTPHMQPTVAKGSGLTSGLGTNKIFGRRNSLGNQVQGNFSTELWKKAFKDACERLCPNRAAGHECGCLSALVRLVMEQLVNRLDVAMFNAILRESADEMPTDPLSDPICEPKVLPIPTGKSSFGAGVELKNAIGSWSRWLTDLFDLEDEPAECGDIHGGGLKQKAFKAFRLLHALSDLMMLPLGMHANASLRKEVCPMFGPTIIKRVLTSFVPDEFSPESIPQNIIDALDTEEVSDDQGDVLTSLPCTASPTIYSPPPAALLMCVGEVGKQVLRSSRLSSLKKSYTSDDELDQLDSPFMSIVPDSFESHALAKLGLIPKVKNRKNVVRYKLLREMWKDDDYY